MVRAPNQSLTNPERILYKSDQLFRPDLFYLFIIYNIKFFKKELSTKVPFKGPNFVKTWVQIPSI